jgi:hypothetical protein
MSNRPGRPPLDPTGPSVAVSLALPRQAFEDVRRRAALERVSVPEIIRRALATSASKKMETARE